MHSNPTILFDGVCNFCNHWVQVALKKDRKGQLRFAPLQSQAAIKLLKEHSLQTTSLSSVVLLENGKAYTQSSAVCRICKHLSGGWKLLYGFIVIPKFIRDGIYNVIARNRYKWFGRKDACMIPSAEQRTRFLQ
jgi:predicted DCC family thiol-disulfide oxidoreductase YuxK